MKIFPPAAPASSHSNREVRGEKVKDGKTGIVRKKQVLPPKAELSPEQIKEKLASHVESSGKSVQKAKVATARLGEGFMNENILKEVSVRPPEIVPLEKRQTAQEIELNAAKAKAEAVVEEKKDLLLKSDIAANDPRDTNTQEKLKTVLSKGAFSFNPREKEVLEKILS